MSDFPTNIRSFDGKLLEQQRIAWPADASPGEQPLRFAAGDTTLIYLSITASGQVVLIEPGVIDVDLTFTSPIVDHENKGDIVLAGRVSID